MRTTLTLIALFGLFLTAHTLAQSTVDASLTPPGGLSPSETPQIMLLTFDDSVSAESYAKVQEVVTNHFNPNGDAIQSTFFVSMDGFWNDFYKIEQLHAQGHEIALHTMSHQTDTNSTLDTWRRELGGCRKAIARFANIPLDEIVGFRAPRLLYSTASYDAIQEMGLRYDASATAFPGDGISGDASNMIWPYTLHDGMQQSCVTGICPTNNYPGLYQVPLYPMFTGDSEWAALMDPLPNPEVGLADTYEDILNLWKTNFVFRYEGNRAPMGIWLHTAFNNQWLMSQPWHTDVLNEFIDWTLQYPDVWYVSMSDCLDFIEDPQTSLDALKFTPFETVIRTPRPPEQISTAGFTDGVTVTASEPPPVHPETGTVFQVWSATAGGNLSSNVFPPYGPGTFDGSFTVSNDTAAAVLSYEIRFRLEGGVITNFYGSPATVQGDAYVIRPYSGFGTSLPLAPGGTMMNAFRGGDATNAPPVFHNLELVFLELGYETGAIRSTMINGAPELQWDNTAIAYDVEMVDLVSGAVTPVGRVVNQTRFPLPSLGAQLIYRVTSRHE